MATKGAMDSGRFSFPTTFFSLVTWAGTPLFYLPIIAYVVRAAHPLSGKLIAVFLAVEVVCGGIKLAYQKQRPIHKLAKNFLDRYNSGSFPSIHTARITSFFVITMALYHNLALAVGTGILVLAVACSRIYLKKHYLIDVAGGFLIGALISTGGLLI